MKNNFWLKLNKPIYALAPMAGITDSAFRRICRQSGADVVYSEMASATALSYNPEKTLEMLVSYIGEQPYIIQLFGSKPKHFEKAVKLLTSKRLLSEFPISKLPALRSGFQFPNGIDINFGCPVKKVAKQGAGAVLMNNKKQAREIIKTAIGSSDLPVSIKIRSFAGSMRSLPPRSVSLPKQRKEAETNALEFLDFVSDLDIKAAMIHGRTMAQGFSGPVDAGIIKQAREFFGGIILANGGVTDYDSCVNLLEKSQADGVGIARGALGRPWIFKAVRTGQSANRSERAIFKAALRHAELAFKLKGERGIIEMRKHLCWYVQGLPGAKKMREKLVAVSALKEIRDIFEN